MLRIDDRLIHGQVLLGWVKTLKIDTIILADDELACDTKYKKLYENIVPSNIVIYIIRLEDVLNMIRENKLNFKKCLLIVDSPIKALRLFDLGFFIKSINIGGIHQSSGREKILSDLWVNASEKAAFQALAKREVKLEMQALPTDNKIDLQKQFLCEK